MVHLWSYLLSHVIDAIIKITVPSVSRKYILCYLFSRYYLLFLSDRERSGYG